MESYQVIAPNGQPCATGVSSYGEAVEQATDLSLQSSALFHVRKESGPTPAFARERARMLQASLDYVRLHRVDGPDASTTKMARSQFFRNKSRLDALLTERKALMTMPDFAFRTQSTLSPRS